MNKKSNVGGQALIEGVMMRGEKGVAIAVRKQNGEIYRERLDIPMFKSKISNMPIIRGVFALVSSMRIGIKALDISAREFGIDEKGKFELWLDKRFNEKADTISLALTILFSLALTILFFGIMPTVITSFLKPIIKSSIILSLIEGIIKMILFISYIVVIRLQKDIKRVFMYHGAEHKAVFNYESGLPLTVENAKTFSRLHPRCGTSFVFFVLAISIVIFSFISWTSPLVRVVLKILFLPIIAGLGFEMLKYTAKSNPVVDVLRKPGMMIQKLTTAEPDDSQLEVALEALKMVVKKEEL